MNYDAFFMHYLGPGFGIIALIFTIIGIIIGILWSILPFAVFGIKPRLDKINNTLEKILEELKKNNTNSNSG